MKVLEVRIKSIQDVLGDFERTFEALEAGRRVSRKEGTFFTSMEAVRNLLTPERVKLVALIHKHEPGSIYELAKLARRDLKNVHEDVRLLERHGIVSTTLEEDKAKTRRVPTVQYEEIRVSIPLDVVSEDAATYLSADTSRYEAARLRYTPKQIRYLLIAESPPKDPSRFFYFEGVWRGDSLFLETVKVLYATGNSDVREIRKQKSQYLRRFRDDGFCLIDAVERPLGKMSGARKVKEIRGALPALLRRLNALITIHRNAKILLVSVPVYRACASALRKEGFEVVNSEPIDFPAQGRQRLYRQKLGKVLEAAGWTRFPQGPNSKRS